MSKLLRSALKRTFVDILFPNTCYICKVPVYAAGTLCVACWQQLDFIAPPHCPRCGKRALSAAISRLCPCSKSLRPLAAVRSALYFNAMAQQVIHKFKYKDKTEFQTTLAKWVWIASHDLIAHIDAFAPIPLHKNRLCVRKYNQAALLTRHLSKFTGKPVFFQLLERQRDTLPQVGLHKKQRQQNVRGAFIIGKQYKENKLAGKCIALVDDVITTGATARECAKILLHEGAQQVYILTVAQRQ